MGTPFGFKWRHPKAGMILGCVRWYLRYTFYQAPCEPWRGFGAFQTAQRTLEGYEACRSHARVRVHRAAWSIRWRSRPASGTYPFSARRFPLVAQCLPRAEPRSPTMTQRSIRRICSWRRPSAVCWAAHAGLTVTSPPSVALLEALRKTVAAPSCLALQDVRGQGL